MLPLTGGTAGVIPERGGFAPEESSFFTSLGILGARAITEGGQRQTRLINVSRSCLRQLRATKPQDAFFTLNNDARRSTVTAFLGKQYSDELCNHVINALVKNWKPDEAKAWVAKLNAGAAYLNQIYGAPKTPIESDPVYQKYLGALTKNLNDNPLYDLGSNRKFEDAILEVESRITRGMGRMAAEDIITYYQNGIDRFFADPQAKNVEFTPLTQGVSRATRERAARAALAVFSGDAQGEQARKDLGIASESRFNFVTSTPKDKGNRTERGTVEDCLRMAESVKTPAHCFDQAINHLQKINIEVFMKNLPETDAQGKPLTGWKGVVARATKEAAKDPAIQWKNGSNADVWVQSLHKALENNALAHFESVAQALMGGEKLSAEQKQKLKATFGQGIAQILGISPNTPPLSSSIAVGAHENFNRCVHAVREENLDGMKARIDCIKSAANNLEEAGVEWLAKNFPALSENEIDGSRRGASPALFAQINAAAHIRAAAGKVYPEGKSFDRTGEAKRIEELTRTAAAKISGESFVLLAESMVKSRSGSAGGLANLLNDQQREIFRRQAELATQALWTQHRPENLDKLTPQQRDTALAKSRESYLASLSPAEREVLRISENYPERLLVLDNKFSYPGSPPGGGTLQDCQHRARTVVEHGKCFELAKSALDENYHEWVAKNIPNGPEEARFVTDGIRNAAFSVYGTPAEQTPEQKENLKKSESSRIADFTALATNTITQEAFVQGPRRHYAEKEDFESPLHQTQNQARLDALDRFRETLGKNGYVASQEEAQKFDGMQTSAIIQTLAQKRPDSQRTEGEHTGLRVINKAAGANDSQDSLSDWIGSLVLGTDSNEGLRRLQNARATDEDSFYGDFNRAMKNAFSKLPADESQSAETYIKRLDSAKEGSVKTALADGTAPLLDEIYFQAVCNDAKDGFDLPKRRKADPKCACATVGGFLRIQGEEGGNLFSSEMSTFGILMRAAAFDSKNNSEAGEIPTPNLGCTNQVKKFLKESAPEMIKTSKYSFLKNPFELLGAVFDRDRARPASEGPSLIDCIIIGNLQTHLAPLIGRIPNALGSIKPTIQKFLDPANLMEIFQGKKSPEIKKKYDDLVGDFKNLVSKPGAIPPPETLESATKNFLAQSAQSLTDFALKSTAAAKPMVYALAGSDPQSQSFLGRMKRHYTLGKAGERAGVDIGKPITKEQLDQVYLHFSQEMATIEKSLMGPLASGSAALAKAVMARTKRPLPVSELNQCASNKSNKLYPLPMPTKEDIASCQTTPKEDIDPSYHFAQLFGDIRRVNGYFAPHQDLGVNEKVSRTVLTALDSAKVVDERILGSAESETFITRAAEAISRIQNLVKRLPKEPAPAPTAGSTYQYFFP